MNAAEGDEEAPGASGEPSKETGPRERPPGSIAPPPIPLGKVIAERYRVTRSIGGGGMGHVFEVEHQALGRRFALKVLRVTGWDEELVRRFEREAKALARIGSVRVAQVSDFGFEEGIGPWFVMELVGGSTLQERLDDHGAVPTREGLELAIALCEAVEDVHAQGIVHRDLKPANIGLPPGPIPLKLLDFGLAAGIDDAMLTRITKSHQVMGSLPYIAPEQFAGARPGKPQDLWAMGIVIYEMFTGRLPFEAPSTAALMHKILTAPPPAFDRFPEGLRMVLDRLLVKAPAKRLDSAAEAAKLLRAIDPTTLPETLALEPPAEEPPESVSFTPPYAVTQPVGSQEPRGEGEAAHVLSAAIGVAEPEPEREEPTPQAARPSPADTSRQGLLLGVALAVIALLIGLVAFLALREPERTTPPAVTAPPTEPVEVPTPMVESAMEAVPTPMEDAMEATPMEAATEATMEEAVAPSTMRRRATRMTRRTTEMSTTPMETAMEASMETAMEPTMEESSWMGEIIGGGWSGEIIEGGR